MDPTRRLPTTVLVAALCLAAVFACGESEKNTRQGLGVYVPGKWQTLRELSGHRVHVQDHRIACKSCHTFGQNDVGPASPSRCAACHEKESRIEHAKVEAQEAYGPNATADCRNCHAFTLDGTGHPAPDAGLDAGLDAGMDGGDAFAFEPADCKRCHLVAQGPVPAVVAHSTTNCTECHHVHESAKPQQASCDGCHEDISTVHGGASQSVVERCTTCHQHQHAEAHDASLHCADCHAKNDPKIPETALFADGHAECTACHAPHAFGKTEAVACRSCHEDVHLLGGTKVQAHQACTNCHSPHDVRGTPENACVRCHTNVHPDHPAKGQAGTCVGCHDPHPTTGAGAAIAKPCGSCHPNALASHGFHSEIACQHCHEPHDFALEPHDRKPCTECHKSEVAHASALAGHASCEGCHRGLPHRPSSLEVGCESCHGNVAHGARKGHEKCLGCHEPHGGTQKVPCAQCHREEFMSAPKGHQACTGCHDPHTGSPAAKPCAACHQTEAASAHGSIGTGCLGCHRPHGPGGVAKPKACASCHDVSTLPGLHAKPQHQACSRCHTGHDAANAAPRAACVACHTDRAQHFPEAARCSGCHLFNPHR